MIAMDIGSNAYRVDPPAQECGSEDLWAEHGWALSGRQTGAILLVVGFVCVVLKLIGA